MKTTLLLSLLVSATPAFAVDQLQCESVTITNGATNGALSSYSPKLVTIDLDKNGEGEGIIDNTTGASVTFSEDNYLKGLYSVLLTRGNSPASDVDGVVMSGLLKKDQIVTQYDLDDFFISTITLKSGESAPGFALMQGPGIQPASLVALTNKLFKAFQQANLQLQGKERISFSRQMMVQEAMDLLSKEKVKSILAADFKAGEVLMMGMGSLCIKKVVP